jgi:hypothetical protein
MYCMGFSLGGPRTVRVPDRVMRGGAPDRQRRQKIFAPEEMAPDACG